MRRKITRLTGIKEIDDHRLLFTESVWKDLISNQDILSGDEFLSAMLYEIELKKPQPIPVIETLYTVEDFIQDDPLFIDEEIYIEELKPKKKK